MLETDAKRDDLHDSLPRFRAVLYMQPSDCSGNLSIIRPILAMQGTDHAPFLELVDVSPKDHTKEIAALLPARLQKFPVRRITRTERSQLRSIGFAESPLLVIYDSQARFRMALSTHPDPSIRVAENRAIRHLVEGDPGR